MRDTNEKLEIFRKLYCLGLSDIEKAFEGEGESMVNHLSGKYLDCRERYHFYGNFDFLFKLDLRNARLLLDYIGFNDK